MTDAQFYSALIAGGVGLFGSGGFARWVFLQWMELRREESADRKSERLEDRTVTIENTKAMTTLAVRVEGLERKLGSMAENFEEISGIHDIPTKKQRARTAPMGVSTSYHVRPRKDDD